MSLLLAGWTLSLRRLTTDVWVVLTAALTVLLSITALAAGPIYSEAMYVAGARQRLSDVPVAEANLLVTARAGSEDSALDQHVSAALDAALAPTGGSLVRAGVSAPYALPSAPAAASDASTTALTVFAFREGIEQHVTPVAGRLPFAADAPTAVAISENAAAELGLSVGQRIALQDRLADDHRPEIEIVGIYRVNDSASAYWYADELLLDGVAPGESFTTYGPLIVTRETFLAHYGRLAELRWYALPDFDALSIAQTPSLRTGVQRARGTLAQPAPGGGLMTVTTELDALLTDIERSLLATRSSVVILTAQLAILALYALLLSTRMLVERRTAHAMLLRARGAGVWQVGAFAMLEGLLLIVPAVVAAPWLAAQSLKLFAMTGPIADAGLALDPQPGRLSYGVAALAGLVCLAVLVLPAMWAARSPLPEQGRWQRAALTTFWQRSGIDLALLAIAVIGFWQLRRYGAPITEAVQGRLEIDPILVASPMLGLLAGAVVALRLIPLLARLAERWFTPRRDAVGALSAWQLARRPGRYTRPALLLILALGIGLFTLAFTSTWQRSQTDQADYQIGADVRVEPSRRVNAIAEPQLAAAYAELDGVESVMALDFRTQSLSRSLGSAQLVVLDADQASNVVRFRDDLADEPFAVLMERLTSARPEIATVPLPGEPLWVAVDVTARLPEQCPDESASAERDVPPDCITVELPSDRAQQLFAAPLTPSLIIRDGNGAYHRLGAPPLVASGEQELVTFALAQQLDDGALLRPSYPIEVVALELQTYASPNTSRRGEVAVHGVAVSEDPAAESWQPVEAALDAQDWMADASALSEAPGVVQGPAIRLEADAQTEQLTAAIATGVVLEFGIGVNAQLPQQPDIFRLRPAGSVMPDVIPVLAGQDLVETLALTDGSELFLSFGLTERPVSVAGTLHAFPGTPDPIRPVLVADLETVLAYQLEDPGSVFPAPDEYWLALPEQPATAAVAAIQQPPFGSELAQSRYERARQLRNDPVTLSTIGALWLGVAVAATFACLGFVSSVAVSLRDRLIEFGLLRVLGLSRCQLAAWLLAENGFLVAICLICGSAVGLALAWLTLPLVTVSRTATEVFPAPLVTVPWLEIFAMQALLVGLLLATSLLATVLLRRMGVGRLLRVDGDV